MEIPTNQLRSIKHAIDEAIADIEAEGLIEGLRLTGVDNALNSLKATSATMAGTITAAAFIDAARGTPEAVVGRWDGRRHTVVHDPAVAEATAAWTPRGDGLAEVHEHIRASSLAEVES